MPSSFLNNFWKSEQFPLYIMPLSWNQNWFVRIGRNAIVESTYRWARPQTISIINDRSVSFHMTKLSLARNKLVFPAMVHWESFRIGFVALLLNWAFEWMWANPFTDHILSLVASRNVAHWGADYLYYMRMTFWPVPVSFLLTDSLYINHWSRFGFLRVSVLFRLSYSTV